MQTHDNRGHRGNLDDTTYQTHLQTMQGLFTHRLSRGPLFLEMKRTIRDIRRKIGHAALKVVVWAFHDSNYIRHLRSEVPDWFKDTGPNLWIAHGTEQLLAVLSSQGHSGFSVGFALKFFETIAKFEPWGPLTGKPEEWGEPYDSEGTQQNKRCSHVFRHADGRAYDINGKVFEEPDGERFTSFDSRVYVEFPYTPTSEVVKVPSRPSCMCLHTSGDNSSCLVHKEPRS
ncbi:MAG: hypothetical protein EKK59_10390 [Neisseriaceae bacterium]|nr:MAG: hypothetical protein EKK59_10390 [Neisseriaceae bacterium]